LEVSDVSYKTVLRFKADLTGDEAARIAADKRKKGKGSY
jgi:stalled ribosome alternative rescue factor ArfA